MPRFTCSLIWSLARHPRLRILLGRAGCVASLGDWLALLLSRYATMRDIMVELEPALGNTTVLGSVAGDITLAQGGFAGVVIAGGLGYRIRETLRTSGFAQRFCAKGRFESMMAGIPVKLIVHPQPGLFGAAAAFAGEHGHA